jgi:uncharacterized RDD family membrane protein YckC
MICGVLWGHFSKSSISGADIPLKPKSGLSGAPVSGMTHCGMIHSESAVGDLFDGDALQFTSMSQPSSVSRRTFSSHESPRMHALEGLPLATFWQRALGYWIDVLLAVVLWAPAEAAWRHFVLHEQNINLKWDFHEVGNIIVALIYFGLGNYYGNGQTPGKWIARTRAMSLTGERMGAWQSIERALGYGAAVLEGGLGFLQFFWDRNRMCAQDRLAETIVVDVRIRASHSS